MTKKQIEQLVNDLADKNLSFGCVIKGKTTAENPLVLYGQRKGLHYATTPYDYKASDYELLEEEFKILGHPITIGRVLSKIEQSNYNGVNKAAVLLAKWRPCNFELSLQEIIEKSEWEHKRDNDGHVDFYKVKDNIQQLKDPNARTLIEYINSLNLK